MIELHHKLKSSPQTFESVYLLLLLFFFIKLASKWGCHEVVHWLINNELENCIGAFYLSKVTGKQLLHHLTYKDYIAMKIPLKEIGNILYQTELLKQEVSDSQSQSHSKFEIETFD
ncbi:hypothetical protein RFI_22049, partial [Reticulomyxa filosa]